MNDSEKMFHLPVILFPHSHLSEDGIKKILTLFGPITIFRPWYMESIVPGNEKTYFNHLKLLNPPNDLRPGVDVKIILSEYRRWIEQNQDRSYREILKANQEIGLEENSQWEIRQMLRRMDQHTARIETDNTIKWHLILHLTQEIENQRLDADSLLRQLKRKGPLLEGIVEETGNIKSLLEDLPHFESDYLRDEVQLKQIFEAWFGLFGTYLEGNERLITLDQHVMDFVCELLKESQGEENGIQGSMVRFTFPDLSHYPLEEMAEIQKRYFSQGKIKEMKDLILELSKDPIVNLAKLDRVSREAEALYPEELSETTLDVIIAHISPLSGEEHLKSHGILKNISNKTFIYTDRKSNDG